MSLGKELQARAASAGELVGERRLREQAEQERIRAEAALKQEAVDRVRRIDVQNGSSRTVFTV